MAMAVLVFFKQQDLHHPGPDLWIWGKDRQRDQLFSPASRQNSTTTPTGGCRT